MRNLATTAIRELPETVATGDIGYVLPTCDFELHWRDGPEASYGVTAGVSENGLLSESRADADVPIRPRAQTKLIFGRSSMIPTPRATPGPPARCVGQLGDQVTAANDQSVGLSTLITALALRRRLPCAHPQTPARSPPAQPVRATLT
jgi:hypothetical protein